MNTILIIEDDKAIVDVLRMILEHDGFRIEQAFNGPAGIEKFKLVTPDIVLLDIRMPKMDGIEVLQELRKLDHRSIIIMISGHGNIEKKLAENNWNISRTAEALDIQRSHLYTKIKQFNIENPEKEDKNQ
jgi:DNA-binding NtrC family response regulator